MSGSDGNARDGDAPHRDVPLIEPPAAEIPLTHDLVRALLADQHPDLADLDIAGPFAGFDMAVFRLGDDLALRVPRHRGAVGSLDAEIRWISLLGGRWTFPTQRIVRTGRPGHGVPWRWVVTSWLPGELAADRPLDVSAAPALGRALAEVHEPAPGDAPFNGEQSIPLAARSAYLDWARARLAGAAVQRSMDYDDDALARLWADALAAGGPTGRVWSHTDLHPFNVISRDGAFGGIIDWSDICGADPAVDLGFLWTLLPASAMPAVLETYGRADDATVTRARGIGLVKAATLAVVPMDDVAAIGWLALVELGVAHPTAPSPSR